jgi:oligopeptide transport system ATP-binding protein
MNAKQEEIIRVENLKKYFYFRRNSVLKALDGISFSVYSGKTLGLVGESGCGKSTLGKTILRLYQPTAGQVLYRGRNVHQIKGGELKNYRKKVQMVFQDAYASLNPRMTVERILGEGMDIHQLYLGKARRERILELLHMVGLNPDDIRRYPHEFSGGQRQRIGIARALAVQPDCIICDEPISALDVSMQAQIINLLQSLQENTKTSYLFISHDLSMIRYLSHSIAVMYLGTLVEMSGTGDLYQNPLHPYTKALLAAVPYFNPKEEGEKRKIVLSGEVPSPYNPPPGCPFEKRCPYGKEICRQKKPILQEAAPGHFVACHLYDS